MKLGEALTLRSQIQTRIEQLRGRVKESALVQEGEEPPEDPKALLAEFEHLATELEHLIVRINRTNTTTLVAGGFTLTEALARRDVLAIRQNVLRQVADVAGERQQRYGLAEIRTLRAIDVASLRRRIDELARERRELDASIQEANWLTDLGE